MVPSPTGVAVAWLLLCWSLLLQLMVAKASTRASVSADRVLDLIIIITKSVIKVCNYCIRSSLATRSKRFWCRTASLCWWRWQVIPCSSSFGWPSTCVFGKPQRLVKKTLTPRSRTHIATTTSVMSSIFIIISQRFNGYKGKLFINSRKGFKSFYTYPLLY